MKTSLESVKETYLPLFLKGEAKSLLGHEPSEKEIESMCWALEDCINDLCHPELDDCPKSLPNFIEIHNYLTKFWLEQDCVYVQEYGEWFLESDCERAINDELIPSDRIDEYNADYRANH